LNSGASHADELFLLFNLNAILEARPGTVDYAASKRMVKLWTDFAKGENGYELELMRDEMSTSKGYGL